MIDKITQYFLGSNKNDDNQKLEIAIKLERLGQKEAALYLFSVLEERSKNPEYIISKNRLLKELGKAEYIIPPEEMYSELQKLQGYKIPSMMRIALELEAHSYKDAALILFQQLVAENPQEKAFKYHVGRLSSIEDKELNYKR